MKILNDIPTGSGMELLELGLKRAGFWGSEIDGVLDASLLKQAISDFQLFAGLEATGKTNASTWTALSPYLTGYIDYRIKSGDTLDSIAKRYGTTIRSIEVANPDIIPEQLQMDSAIVVPLPFDIVSTDISFSSYLMAYELAGLSARYPFIHPKVIGSSVMGRKLYSMDIGSGKNNVFYNASHHANEWITSHLLMKFLEDYAKAFVSGEELGGINVSDIFTSSTITLVPLVNPDGVDLVTGALNGSQYYENAKLLSEHYQNIAFPSGWKANINGTDLNLQYPAGWHLAREIKRSKGYIYPGPRDYVGDSPLSEPESRAVYNLTNEHNFSLTLSYHTQGKVIYWKYDDYLPPNSWEIAQEFSRLSGYALEETPGESGNAGYKDWFIQTFDRPGYTFEAGLGINPLPLSQFDKIYQDNIGVLTSAAIISF